MTLYEAYLQGIRDGFKTHAIWRAGKEEVGSNGTLLKDAKRDAESAWNFDPPKEES